MDWRTTELFSIRKRPSGMVLRSINSDLMPCSVSVEFMCRVPSTRCLAGYGESIIAYRGGIWKGCVRRPDGFLPPGRGEYPAG
jgi:hypothetical protein